ncbi:MAG TPA: glutamine--fructose-6-phosphate transaminase (isomerizing) [Nitrososphaerales archaeon]|nr:glutamine--fructose-6-phosphate transaminase (isomerizing) [Nitrososphaerales archaeon]
MCGIIAYAGAEDAAPILLEGLKRLEYRGYDSAGILTVDSNSQFALKKDIGKVLEIHERVNLLDLKGSMGIAHTRWATHGGVTKQNAHPHISNNGKIAVIHNGIIENYKDLKAQLESQGFRFLSETDTEVVPNLIEYWMRIRGVNFVQAALNSFQSLEGNFALVVIDADSKTIVGSKNGSPLVLGVGRDNSFFLASDIPAFLDRTKDVVYLYDGDTVVIIQPNGAPRAYEILDFRTGKKVERPVQSVSWDIEHAAKGEFDHFMLKEISEQVETIQRAASQDRQTIQEITAKIQKARGVFLIGCGSSYHACLSVSYLFSKLASFHINTVLASEFSAYEDFLKEDTLVIAVTQSGETIDVLDAIKTAKQKGCQIISIVNVMGSSATQFADTSLFINAGPEVSVLSTKTYTAQLAVLTLLAFSLAGKYDEGVRELKYLWNTVYNLTSRNMRTMIQELADRLSTSEHIFVLGRGSLYATALEAALKIKEVSYIHAEAFAGGELKHGPISLIGKGTPVIVFVSKDTESKILSNAMEVKSRGGYLIGIGPAKIDAFDFFIRVPEDEELNPICQIIPIQILAYQLAVILGHDPDRPRNLAKSVTVR